MDMILLEILTKKFTNLEVNEDSALSYDVDAKIGNRKINFTASRWAENEGPSLWEVEFSEEIPPVVPGVTRTHHTYEITKSGKEFEVFAFVKQCMEHVINKHKPKFIKFTADKAGSISRASIYERLLKKFLKGYSIKVMDDGSRQVKFTLEKL